jgi:hypothetical protein
VLEASTGIPLGCAHAMTAPMHQWPAKVMCSPKECAVLYENVMSTLLDASMMPKYMFEHNCS